MIITATSGVQLPLAARANRPASGSGPKRVGERRLGFTVHRIPRRDTENTNLSLDRRTKKVLIALAVQDGLPVSQIVERLTIEEAQRRQMPTPFPVRRVDAVNPAPLNPSKRLARAVKK